MLNQDNPVHAKAAERLRDELIIWMTTVTGSGQPKPTPVWFVWDGQEFLVYSLKDGRKTDHIAANPRVSLHLDGNGRGGGIVIFEGTARVDPDGPRADEDPTFVAKYRQIIDSYGWTPASFADDYPHLIRVCPTHTRIW
jgi:PPOX class probable F420-dependent enzyme